VLKKIKTKVEDRKGKEKSKDKARSVKRLVPKGEERSQEYSTEDEVGVCLKNKLLKGRRGLNHSNKKVLNKR